MKNAIVTFIERHPIMSFLIVCEVVGSTRDAIIGVTRAITGRYPTEQTNSDEEELNGLHEEVSGDVVDILN